MDFDNASFRKITEDADGTVRKEDRTAIHFPIRENEKFVRICQRSKESRKKMAWIRRPERRVCRFLNIWMNILKNYRENSAGSSCRDKRRVYGSLFCMEKSSPMHEIMMALTQNVSSGDIVPVAMGSPVQLRGVANLLDDIVQYFPSPDKRSVAGINTKTNEIFEANYDFAKAKSAQYFQDDRRSVHRKIFYDQSEIRRYQER